MSDNVRELIRAVEMQRTSFEQARKLYADRLAPDFKLFDFIDHGEVRTSEIIAWLLDPKGSHGQSERFLRCFLDRVWPEAMCDPSIVTISAEKSSAGGRYDIAIELGNKATLVVENKLFALDQRKQLHRYFANLQHTQPNHRVLYLTIHGSLPSEYSITKEEREQRFSDGSLMLWSYRGDVIGWLGACAACCRSDRVRLFIDELSQHLLRVSGGTNVNEDSAVVDVILRSPESITAAMQIGAALKSLRSKLLERLVQRIQEMGPSNWTVKQEWRKNSEWVLSIDVDDSSPVLFAFECFGGDDFRHMNVGALRKAGAADLSGLASRLADRFGQGKQEANWPWWQPAQKTSRLLPIDGNWSADHEAWAKVASGEYASLIVDAAQQFHAAVQGPGRL